MSCAAPEPAPEPAPERPSHPLPPTLQLAVGYNHTIAVASDGGVWTWGFGGYGRLGHKVQQARPGGP